MFNTKRKTAPIYKKKKMFMKINGPMVKKLILTFGTKQIS